MSILTTVTVTRGTSNTLIASHVACQIDNSNDEVAVDHHEVGVDFYRWITHPGFVPAVIQGDTLTDEASGLIYRVRGQVDTFAFHHVEAKIDHKRMT